MKNNDKNLIRLLIILIVILIVIISIFSLLLSGNKESSDNDNNKNQYKDEEFSMSYTQEGKYKPSVINSEFTLLESEDIEVIDNIIDRIVDYLNEKNYAQLYSLVPVAHKKIKFNNLEKFQSYIDSKYPSRNYKCLSYKLDNNVLYIKLGDVVTSDEQIPEIRLIGYKNINNIKLYFENISEVQESTTRISFSDVSINMQYIVEYEDKMSAFIKLTNKSSSSKKIKFNELKLSTIINGEERAMTTNMSEEILVDGNSTSQVELYFDTDEDLLFLPDFIDVNVTVNGETKSQRTTVIYPASE